MALMDSFFKDKKKSKPSSSLVSEEITLEKLKQLIPIRNLSEEMLQSFALENKSEVFSAGEILFIINSVTDSAIYLLKGTVSLSD
ncbi:MAG: histidine kinase, partial [Methylococcales bacterium]|nr:histidine kinase [Methylococcales bacterium]